MPEIEHTI